MDLKTLEEVTELIRELRENRDYTEQAQGWMYSIGREVGQKVAYDNVIDFLTSLINEVKQQ